MAQRALMIAAAMALAGDPKLQIAAQERAMRDDEPCLDLTSEQWQAKFIFLDKWGKMSGAQSLAARAYPSVKLTTLRSRYDRRDSGPKKMGPPPRLDEAIEKLLVDFITYVHEKGFPVTNNKLTVEVKKIALQAGGPEAQASVGGKSWRKGFQHRHPDLTRMNTALMERVRKMSLTKEAVARYFDLADIGLTGVKACNIFFADETYVDLHSKKGLQVRAPPPTPAPCALFCVFLYLPLPYNAPFLGVGALFRQAGVSHGA